MGGNVGSWHIATLHGNAALRSLSERSGHLRCPAGAEENPRRPSWRAGGSGE
jgi:hypothetical protein